MILALNKPSDFDKIRTLERASTLQQQQFLKLIGATRQSYNRWCNGGKIKPLNAAKMTPPIKALVFLMHDESVEVKWPFPETLNMDHESRYKALLDALANLPDGIAYTPPSN